MSNNQERTTNEEVQPPVVPNLQMQALMGEFRRMMRVELEQIHERLDRVEEGTQRGQPQLAPNVPRRNRVHRRGVDEVDYEGDEFEDEFDRRYGNREVRMGRHRQDDDLGGIKVKIPDEDIKAARNARDPIQVPIGPVMRARAKRFKEEINNLVQRVL